MGSRLALGLGVLLVVGCAPSDCEVVTAEEAAPLYFASDSEPGAQVEVVMIGEPVTVFLVSDSAFSATKTGKPKLRKWSEVPFYSTLFFSAISATVWFSTTTSGGAE